MGDSGNTFISPLNSRTVAAIGISAIAGGASIYYLSRARVKPQLLDGRRPVSSKAQAQDNKGQNTAEGKEDESQTKTSIPEWAKGVMPSWAKDVPQWANEVPGMIKDLQHELSIEPGTLADEMWQEASDPEVHPEIMKDAKVRVSTELCPEEEEYLRNRKKHTKKALAKYLDIPENDIHEDDVPVIGMCGSGGGLRAMVAGTSSYLSAQQEGLFDCITYTAGVSGSCWLQQLFYSSITKQRHDKLIDHLKQRLHVHIAFPPPLLKLLTTSPTNKFLLAGGFEKWKGFEKAEFGLVDIYGVLLGARLLVPAGEINVDSANAKVSHQERYLRNGENPLPIYTAVRHEIPSEEAMSEATEEEKEKAKKEAWFQWFEITPYEMWCEEVAAGIPTWSVGRTFKDGKDVKRQNGLSMPEIRSPLLMGIWGSAFCATLSHYYHEIRPLLKGLTGFGGLDQLIEQRNEHLVKVHPIDPAQIGNYVVGMKEQLPDSCPESLFEKDSIELMDAGMSNNLPIYPLLRPGRNVDIVIAFDASADIKSENWLRVADGYARQRGIRAWPQGTGFPIKENLDDADQATHGEAENKVQQAEENQKSADEGEDREDEQQNPQGEEEKQSAKPLDNLGFCNIWVGTTEERSFEDEPPPSKQVEEDWELMSPDAGIAVIYFPFLANPNVEGVDPQTSEFMSTWNFIYKPEDIDKVVSLAQANFDEGKDRVKKTVKAVYERKKKQRLEREKSQE